AQHLQGSWSERRPTECDYGTRSASARPSGRARPAGGVEIHAASRFSSRRLDQARRARDRDLAGARNAASGKRVSTLATGLWPVNSKQTTPVKTARRAVATETR